MPDIRVPERRPLVVAIEPSLRRDFGPEIAWALRHALTTLGYTWREVGPEDPRQCDIVYSERRPDVPAPLWIPAERSAWARARDLRWAGMGTPSGLASSETAFLIAGTDDAVRGRDFPFVLYWLAVGFEERHVRRNKHGHLDFTGTTYLRDEVFRRAVGSEIVTSLGRALRGRGIAAPPSPWPEGKRAAFCCGHDVDYPEVFRWLEPARILLRQRRRGLRSAVAVAAGVKHHWNFHAWTALERRYGLRSAFYFVPRRGSLWEYALSTPDPFYDVRRRRFRTLFGELADQGNEIGTHASYKSFSDEEAFRAEKHVLERASGAEVAGNRHHYWHLDPESPEATLMMHARLGFEYDASLAHERHLGWRRTLCTPFFPFHPGERRQIETLQIPTAWMDDQLFGYRHLNPGDPHRLLGELVNTVATHQGCLMVDVHDYVFDEDLFPGWRASYEYLLELVAARGDFWLATPREIARQWTQRYRRLVSASAGLDGGRATMPVAH